MIRAVGATLSVALSVSCGGSEGPEPYDMDFDIPRTESFPRSLSDYGLYSDLRTLKPSSSAHLYELASELYTDQAHKQRLLMLPDGTSIAWRGDDNIEYPEGTVLAKTFYYPVDMSDIASELRVVETRLLVKTDGLWNVATYIWNEEQSDATLLLDGMTTPLSWTDANGKAWFTDYAVPHEGECVTCHQAGGASMFIGPTPQNLHRSIERDGEVVDQLTHLTRIGVLQPAIATTVEAVPDYLNADASSEERARAYLDINCAHCHNPRGWDEVSGRDMDFRYATPLGRSGIDPKAKDILRAIEAGEMPYLGVTLPHQEGARIVADYVESL